MNQPLVTIIVITYNSSKYILETLESAKEQTYQDIELIVSDDGSSDNTIEIVSNWINRNKKRFIHTNIITTPINTGIPANCNRGVTVSQGEWIKLIAGDDLLLRDCIQQNVNFINENPAVSFVFSRVICFDADKEIIDIISNNFNYSFFSLNVKEQFKYLIFKSNCIPAVSGFIKKESLMKLNKFDERIRLLEDYPMWIKATRNGNKLFFLNEETVKYRIGNNSISQTNLSKAYYKSNYLLFFYYILPSILIRNPFLAFDKFILLKSKSCSSKFCSIVFTILRFLSPYAYIKLFKKISVKCFVIF